MLQWEYLWKKKKKEEIIVNFFFWGTDNCDFLCISSERENGEKPKRLASSQRDWLPHKKDMQQHMGWKEENHAAK